MALDIRSLIPELQKRKGEKLQLVVPSGESISLSLSALHVRSEVSSSQAVNGDERISVVAVLGGECPVPFVEGLCSLIFEDAYAIVAVWISRIVSPDVRPQFQLIVA